LDALGFVEKWGKSSRTERSAAQEHFLNLRELVGHPQPGDVDVKGLSFTTEKRIKKYGGFGLADAFKASVFDLADRELDEAVFAAHGLSPSMRNEELLAALLELNLSRPAAEPGKAKVAEADEDEPT
jgi:hypothetical protein